MSHIDSSKNWTQRQPQKTLKLFFFFYSVSFFAQSSKILEKLYIGKVVIQTLVPRGCNFIAPPQNYPAIPYCTICRFLEHCALYSIHTFLGVEYVTHFESIQTSYFEDSTCPLAFRNLGAHHLQAKQYDVLVAQWSISGNIFCNLVQDDKERYYNLSFVKSNIIKYKLDINEIF